MSKDRYTVIRPLGTGNFTAGVYLAEHRDLGRVVAVKLLPISGLANRDALLVEARTMAALERHDNVVQVLDAGDWDATYVYIASEVCRGGSVEALCSPPASPLDPGAACSLVSAACRGVAFMHDHGLLHLDIRPANILLDNGVAKVGDFGLARWLTDSQVPAVYAPHAAPEMLRDYRGSVASDQYAMAMTLAHALTGGNACTMPPSPTTVAAWRGFPALRTSLGPNVPERLMRVLVKATKFNLTDRYASIEQFKRAVDQATPAVAFARVGRERMESRDGVWDVEWTQRRAGWSIDVRRNGRRIGPHCASGLDDAAAATHVAGVVAALAYP